MSDANEDELGIKLVTFHPPMPGFSRWIWMFFCFFFNVFSTNVQIHISLDIIFTLVFVVRTPIISAVLS